MNICETVDISSVPFVDTTHILVVYSVSVSACSVLFCFDLMLCCVVINKNKKIRIAEKKMRHLPSLENIDMIQRLQKTFGIIKDSYN